MEPAAEDFGYKYIEALEGAVIYGYYGVETMIRIPSVSDGNTVKSVNFVVDNDSVEHIELLDSITEIDCIEGYTAEFDIPGFYHFSSLTSIIIPNSVEVIGNSVFVDCDDLTVTVQRRNLYKTK